MKRFWRYARKVFLIVAVCSLMLQTGCGSRDAAKDAETGQVETQQIESQQSETRQSETGQSAEQQASADQAETGRTVAESQNAEQSTEENTQPDYVMVVKVTINPEIALYLAQDGTVVDVEYLNEDAQNAFSDLEMKGVSLETAVSMIVDTSAEEGYLAQDRTIIVDFAETAAEETVVQKLSANVQEAVRDTLTKRQLSAALTIELEGEVQETAKINETPCPACEGTGICPECGGGTLPCKMCGGSLWESCGTCKGSGKQTCPGCRGTGKDATDGSSCRHCSGAGTITCEVCKGVGGKDCSICNGKGVVSDDCILCHGGKKCTACGGTGVKQE